MDEQLIDESPGDKIGDRIAEAGRRQRDWRKEFKEAHAFYAGHQWRQSDIELLEAQGRPMVTFNRIGPLVDSVTGFQALNKQEIKFRPRGVNDGGASEVLNLTADWIREQTYADDEDSHAFEDAVIGGIGWTDTRPDYDDDPQGRMGILHVPALEMRWDPSAKRKNLEDTKWRARLKRYDQDELIEEFGEEIASQIKMTRVEDPDVFASQSDDDDAYAEPDWGYDEDSGKYVVAQYQECYKQTYYRVGNPLSGRIEELDEEQFLRMQPRLDAMGIRYIKQRRKAYRQMWAAGPMVWDEVAIPRFTFNAITGKYDMLKGRFYGIVRPMIDPQRWNNKLYSESLHILNTNAKGGMVAEEDAVDNPNKFEDEWAAADSVVWVKPGAIGSNKLMPKPVGEYPASLDKLLMQSIESIGDVSAINPEFIGAANREQAGVLEVERKKAALVVLGGLFDGIKRYRKVQGRLLLHYISRYVPDEQILKVAGERALQLIPAIRSPDVLRYDVAVDTAPESPNQKQEIWGILQVLVPTLLNAGVPIPPSLVKYLPLPESVTAEWEAYIKQMTQPKPPSPAEQAMADNIQAQTYKTLADARDADAQARERESKVALNQAAAAAKAAEAVETEQQVIQNAAIGAVTPFTR